jgi:hypothetical protein
LGSELFKVTDEEVLSKVPLSDLNHEIQRCLYGYENGGTSQGRKAFFDRLVWLEKIREASYGVEATARRFGRK